MPRDVLEAARTDGASEWQVFRRVTVPLLAPVLSVVFVTMIINVLKVFDIVLSLAPESSQASANVIARRDVAHRRSAASTTSAPAPRSPCSCSSSSIPVLAPEHPPLQEGGLMTTATAETVIVIPEPARQAVGEDRCAAVAKTPVHIALAILGLLWLIPTLGLFITSILPASTLASKGWWQIFSHPSIATWSNYNAMFHNHGLITALTTTAEIAVGNTILVVVDRRARRVRARVARVPGPRLDLHRRSSRCSSCRCRWR